MPLALCAQTAAGIGVGSHARRFQNCAKLSSASVCRASRSSCATSPLILRVIEFRRCHMNHILKLSPATWRIRRRRSLSCACKNAGSCGDGSVGRTADGRSHRFAPINLTDTRQPAIRPHGHRAIPLSQQCYPARRTALASC